MDKIKRIGLSMGSICLASAVSMSGAFAMKPNKSSEASTGYYVSSDQTAEELKKAKAELSELKAKFDQQTEELTRTKLELAAAQERIWELESLPNIKELENLKAEVEKQQKQLESACEEIAKKDAEIEQLKKANAQHHTTSVSVSESEKELSLIEKLQKQLEESERARVAAETRSRAAETRSRAAEAEVEELKKQRANDKELLESYESRIMDLQIESENYYQIGTLHYC